jgi:hypothetical protein
MPTATDGFTPLLPGTGLGGSPPSFRLTVLPAESGSTPSFHNLPDTSAAPTPGPAHCSASRKPQVSLLRDGEVITGIQVHCACGEVITLDCLYDSPSDR